MFKVYSGTFHPSNRWHGGTVGRISDLRFIGLSFESCLGTIAQWPWASYLHLSASVTKQYDSAPAKAEEYTDTPRDPSIRGLAV